MTQTSAPRRRLRRHPEAELRLATPEDADRVYWFLLRELLADNDIGLGVSLKRSAAYIRHLCSGEAGVVAIIEDKGEIIGSVGIALDQVWWSDDYFLSQKWLIVAPSVRRSAPHYKALFQFASDHRSYMSSRAGRDIILEHSVFSFKRLPEKIRLWARFGEQIGATFWSRGGADEQERQHVDDDDQAT